MSANVYSVANLLVGKMYYSRSVSGEIIDAEKTDKVWYADCDSYRIQVRAQNTFRDTYRYVAVKVGE
jgi:hypothetical protein